MARRNPFTVSQAELDSLKVSLDKLAAEYVAPLNTLALRFEQAIKTFEAVNRSEPETRAALRDLAQLIEGVGLSGDLRARQGHEFWEQKAEATALIVAEPVIGSDPNAKRNPAKSGREYAEAGYSLNQLLDAATWTDAAATETHLAVLMSGRVAQWELRDCGDALVRELRRRTLPNFAPRFEALTVGNLAWPELRGADRFGEPEKFALGDWREWLMVRDADRPAGIDECLSLGPLPRFAAEPDAPEVPAAPANPPDGPGFPHPEEYLPEGINNSVADTWPMARRQLYAFRVSLDVANGKLGGIDSRLPHGFRDWWVRSWADALLFRSHRPVEDAAGARAWYEFGRVLDRELHISATAADSSHPRDAEFTYYDRPLMRGDGRGNDRAQPFAGFGYLQEDRAGLTPVAFPNAPAALPNMPRHRLCCEQLLEWGGFLTSPEPLTAEQVDALGHVGCSTVGENGWCAARGTHGEQCGPFDAGIRQRLRHSIQQVSDRIKIAVQPVSREGLLSEALDAVSSWLERAELLPTPPDERAVTPVAETSATVPTTVESDSSPRDDVPIAPVWDSDTRTLTIGVWSKYAYPQAKNVAKVFEQFQRLAWPKTSITPEVLADLDDLRKSLNDWLGDNPPIAFSRDGTGKGIRWGYSA